MTEWQPIETAPKDGSKILVVMDGGVHIARWDDQRHANRPKPFFYATDIHYMGSIWMRANQPTDWMPLPEPPK